MTQDGEWLQFQSSRVPLRLWLTAMGKTIFLAALSQLHVARALTEHGLELTNPMPQGAVAVRSVSDLVSLHHLVRRAFSSRERCPMSCSIPFCDEPSRYPVPPKSKEWWCRELAKISSAKDS